MKTNLDKFKDIIYKQAINNPLFDFSLLGGEFKGFHNKREEALIKLEHYISNIDIRVIEYLAPEIKERFPKWYKQRQFYIDYNKNGELDIIRMVNL